MDIQIDNRTFLVDARQAIEYDVREFEEKLEQLKSGELPEVDFKRFRLHRGIYGQRSEQPGYNMVRVKIPGGILTSEQLRILGYIASEYADGLAHITTRQDIQYHWVKLETVPAVMRKLAEADLTTREACGNTVRNVVGSPTAGVSSEEAFDISPYLLILAKRLIRNKLTQKLPRKFKISFSGSDTDKDGIIPWIHDIGFVAKSYAENGSEKLGFKVYVGGGLGAHPRIADVLEEFLPLELFVPTAEAIITIFGRHGDHINRKRSRMKYVLWKLGYHQFKKLVYEERDKIIQSSWDFPEPDIYEEQPPENGRGKTLNDIDIPQHEFDFWKQTSVFHQKQRGYNVVIINPVIGDLTVEQLYALGDIVETFSDGTVRTSATQDIVMRWIKTEDLKHLYYDLKTVGLDFAGADSIGNVTACPGADTCQLGITYSRALGKELTMFFKKNSGWSKLLRDLRIKISGCPNSCGQHHVASIGFHGAARKVHGRLVPHYIMFIGGGLHSGDQIYGEIVTKIPARRITDAVMRVIKYFLSERKDGEDFWAYVKRVGPKSFKNKLQDLAYVPTYEEAPEWYSDLGQETEFEVRTGEGECMS